MLKINLSATDALNLEESYWRWFKSYQLKHFLNVIDNSLVLQEYFFYNRQKYQKWKSEHMKPGISSKDLLDCHCGRIKNVILTKPHKLESRQLELESNIILSKNSNEYNYFLDTYKKIRRSKMISKVFFKHIKLKTCPYCNRSFFASINKKNGKTYLTIELDHYYPKEQNPVLAIALYNLIPSCHTCNHLKSKSTLKITNPYLEDYGDGGKFKFDDISIINLLLSSNQLNSNASLSYRIESTNVIIQNSVKTFGINDLYKAHLDDVVELIHKKRIFTNERVNELFTNYLVTNGYSKEQIKAFVFSHYSNASYHSDKILSKFLNDLYNDLNKNGL